MNNRKMQLLSHMAKRFADMQYVDSSFVHEHNIKSSELDVFELAADIINAYIAMPTSDRLKVLLQSKGVNTYKAAHLTQGMRMNEAREDMKSLNP